MQTPSFYADRLQEFPFHVYWHALPDIESTYQLNPFSYAQRMEGYKLLMAYMNEKGAFGGDNEYNPFWGLVTELDWLWRSGRLGSPLTPQPALTQRDEGGQNPASHPSVAHADLTAQPSLQVGEGEKLNQPDVVEKALMDEIAVDSWWGCCNTALSVIPMIAAMQVGMMPQLEILLPQANEIISLEPPDDVHRALQAGLHTEPDIPLELKFAQGGGDAGGYSVPAPLKKAVETWRALFKQVKQTKAGADLEPLRVAFWEAHLVSVTAAARLYASELRLLPHVEQTFVRGWSRVMEFLGAAAWKTDLAFLIENGHGHLPTRILQKDVVPGRIPDMDAATTQTLLRIFKLGTMNRLRFRFHRWLWKRAMRTREARDRAPQLLRATLDSAPEYKEDRKQLGRYMRAGVQKKD